MLAASGSDPATAVGGLTAISILGIGGLLALPIFVLPAIIAGTPIDRGLEHAALLGIGAFFLFAGFSAVVLVVDGPMRWAGRLVQAVRNKVLRKRAPLTGLPERLVTERNRIRDVLGLRWKAALLLSSGRLAFDFMTLLACIWATGTKPAPSLVLLAYAVAGTARAHPDHAGRPGHRRGRAERHAHPGRHPGWRRGAGHPGLPDHLVLAARAGRAGGLHALPGALRAARSRHPPGAHGHGRGLSAAGRGWRHAGAGGSRGVSCTDAVPTPRSGAVASRPAVLTPWPRSMPGDACAPVRGRAIPCETATTMYEGTWDSVRTHGVPDWYHDAKLGVFVHWGLYSVPGWAPRVPDIQQMLVKDGPKRMLRENPYAEWYLNSMQIKGSPTQRHHREVYGDDYPYDNFVARPSTTPRRGRPRCPGRPVPHGRGPLRRA